MSAYRMPIASTFAALALIMTPLFSAVAAPVEVPPAIVSPPDIEGIDNLDVAEAPEVPEIEVPDVEAPEIEVPEVTVPEVEAPEVEIPDTGK